MFFNKSIEEKVLRKWQKEQQEIIDFYGEDFYLKSKNKIETTDTSDTKTHELGNGIRINVSEIQKDNVQNPYCPASKDSKLHNTYGNKIIYLIIIDTGKDVRFYESKLFNTFEEADNDREALLRKLSK